MLIKKKNIIIIVILLKIIITPTGAYEKKKYLLPPFENFSQYKSKTSYEVTLNDINDPSVLVKRVFQIDQYSESARSILENKMIELKIKIIERLRVDQMLGELGITNNSDFVNRESSLEMGKMVGADTLIMGTIMNIQSKEEEIKAYGINQKITHILCTTRIRIIDIESGNVFFSKIAKGKSSSFSSTYGGKTDSDDAYSALEDSIEILANDADFKKIVSR